MVVNLFKKINIFLFALAISKRSIQHFVNVGKVSSSVTRWGEFWKVCATNFLTKVGQIFSNWYRLLFEKHHLWVKRLIFIFGQLLWKSGLLFSSTSGHTAGNPTSNLIKWLESRFAFYLKVHPSKLHLNSLSPRWTFLTCAIRSLLVVARYSQPRRRFKKIV